MHRHAFTPIEGLWFAQNLPCLGAMPLSAAARGASSQAALTKCTSARR